MSSEAIDVGNTQCVVVFTNRGRDRLWEECGSQAWRMDASRASKCEYVVCVQNRNGNWGQPTAPHKEAFMIGKIKEIVPSDEDSGRQKIVFSSTAEISVPNMWGGNRNPVAYMTLGDFGIHTQEDIESLRFTKITGFFMHGTKFVSPGDDYQAAEEAAEDAADSNVASTSVEQVLTIEEAKRGLARKFGVSEAQIEIVIRA